MNSILNQAHYHYQHNNIDKAIVFFEKVRQIDYANESAILGLGYCYQKLKNFDEAINFFKEYTINNRAKYWKRAQYNLALCCYSKNDLKLTEVELTRLIKYFPDDDDSIQVINSLTLSLLFDHQEKQNYQQKEHYLL